ncbi:hypothetical protein NDU88_000092 [Pleurodeles waltl]|uniref:Uncharacterized protein n=1 Tax=Pleurodeles waltl TaxID=8319 RepID=A0AAV7UP09_PLEWA|nr:hypothetical protein NDU88_000092 [Pleurodeles waltl]
MGRRSGERLQALQWARCKYAWRSLGCSSSAETSVALPAAPNGEALAVEPGRFLRNPRGLLLQLPDSCVHRKKDATTEPDEVWALLGAYRRGPTDIKQVENRQPRRQSKRQHAKDSQKYHKVTKPTSQQTRQGKRAALQGTASLTEARSSEDGQRSEPESLNGEDTTDIESMTSVTEGLPQVTPQTSVDII